MTQRDKFWYKRFRTAAYLSAIGLLILTLLTILPFRPFSYLPPIIAAGGPGTWFLLGYVLYASVGFAGFAGLSSLLFVIETYERREPDGKTMTIALGFLYLGVTSACVLLSLAGAFGGYAVTMQGESAQVAEGLLGPYVYAITIAALASVIGAGILILGVTRAKAAPTE